MGLFTRKKQEGQVAHFGYGPEQVTGKELPPLPKPLAVSSLLNLVPIGRILDNITSVIRDPNGKLSSKRAGAGALVVAGINFLANGQRTEGIIALGFALGLFFLTKYDPTPQP
jgi:hypothetical protein